MTICESFWNSQATFSCFVYLSTKRAKSYFCTDQTNKKQYVNLWGLEMLVGLPVSSWSHFICSANVTISCVWWTNIQVVLVFSCKKAACFPKSQADPSHTGKRGRERVQWLDMFSFGSKRKRLRKKTYCPHPNNDVLGCRSISEFCIFPPWLSFHQNDIMPQNRN